MKNKPTNFFFGDQLKFIIKILIPPLVAFLILSCVCDLRLN